MKKMPLWLTASYPDYLLQLAFLLYDPIYRGINVPKGRGKPIFLIPGFLAGDWTMTVMAGWLNRIGYRAYFSGVNWNVDCPNRTGDLLGWRLDQITQETGSPLIVIGHSLGGLLARFLGANFSEKISHVVSLGAPVDGSSIRVHPFVPLAFRTLQALRRDVGGASPNCGSPRCTCQFGQTAFAPLPKDVGSTSIFTKQDEVVDWRACFDPQGANREVSGRHISLIVNRQVYSILASVLASVAVANSQQPK